MLDWNQILGAFLVLFAIIDVFAAMPTVIDLKKKGKTILGSTWIVSLDEKSKITKMMLQANIFEL